jgi:excisionase family DNA binding protein
MKDNVQRETMTVPEAARRLGIGRNQAYDAARCGQIPTIKIGKRVLIPRAAFERMLNGSPKAA